MAEIRQLITLERRNMPDGADVAEYRVPIEADADLFRYATYGLDGIIKGFGDEFSWHVTGSNFEIGSGKAAINGRTAITNTTKTFNVGTSSTNYFWVIYIEINMSIASEEKAELVAAYQTGVYPVITNGEDLTNNPFGVARRELYRFQAASGTLSYIQKTLNVLEYIEKYLPIIIPQNRISTRAELNGAGATEISQSGILEQGWYEVELAAGGGGGAGNYSSNNGGAGGYLKSVFFVSFNVNYKICAGGGGAGGEGSGAGQGGGGGGGGGSVLDIPQIGVLFVATGGGGGRSNAGNGGGGGGYGGGGGGIGSLQSSNSNYGGRGGAGGFNQGGVGGYPISTGNVDGGTGGGSGGGRGGLSNIRDGGGTGGGMGGWSGGSGGNNISITLGGGGAGGAGVVGNGNNGANGYARLYRLG